MQPESGGIDLRHTAYLHPKGASNLVSLKMVSSRIEGLVRESETTYRLPMQATQNSVSGAF